MPIQIPEAVAGYETYTEATDFSIAGEEEQLVLFFHADRCSSCKRIEQDIKNTGVPAGIRIYEVDRDEYPEIAQQYDMRTQSSFVQVDREGELIKRRVGWFGIDDIVEKLNDDAVKPREKVRAENAMIDTSWSSANAAVAPKPVSTKKAYFAGGCFWCLEGPFEAMEWVLDVVSGYAWWRAETANYRSVWWWDTKHREAVEVSYDPSVVEYKDLVQTFLWQIDPTDTGGQFADRWFQYTTAVYTQSDEEIQIAQEIFQELEDSKRFDEAIVVQMEDFSTFFPAEEEHQDYYRKNSAHYQRYAKWSGRKGFIEDNRKEESDRETTKVSVARDFQWGIGEEKLTDLQKKVIFEQGTEPPFQNKYRDHKEDGIYVDIVDGTPLFSSTDKFESGTWRPSFTQPIEQSLLDLHEDRSYGMVRTEVETTDGKHLGHVFNDWPGWGERYCINSAALDFVALEDMEKMGYGEYLVLFES